MSKNDRENGSSYGCSGCWTRQKWRETADRLSMTYHNMSCFQLIRLLMIAINQIQNGNCRLVLRNGKLKFVKIANNHIKQSRQWYLQCSAFSSLLDLFYQFLLVLPVLTAELLYHFPPLTGYADKSPVEHNHHCVGQLELSIDRRDMTI